MTISLKKHSAKSSGFTLVEVLTVITIMLVLASLSAMTVPGIISSQTMSQAASDISQTLDDARSYAIANHTYVFVGFEEVSAANVSALGSQAQATSSAGGRIAVTVVASQDGTNNSTSTAPYFNSANLVAISKLKIFSGVHMADLTGLTTTSGPMAARVATATNLGANSTTGGTALYTWPLGSSGGNVSYSFFPSQVIVFDQEGTASLVTTSTYTSTTYSSGLTLSPAWLEIGLQFTHGSIVPTAPTSSTLPTGQIASIQLDGVTGGNRVLRP
jgi:prepilin-type N-terminal cleavage/methylation domain-containing protein